MGRRRKVIVASLPVLLVVTAVLGVWRQRIIDRERLLDREAQLRQILNNLRDVIDSYTYDKKKAPQSLDDLVKAGYFRNIPADPITGRADWVTVPEDTMESLDQTQHGIDDVHSRSNLISTEGTAYSTW